MKRHKPEVTEVECPACEGTGFPVIKQPVQPGRKIFPAPCQHCFGKGKLPRNT
jgi:DnaJ-class molecular chaperone